MGGVFMRKLGKRLLFCFLLAALFWCGTLIADRQRLNEELIRFHVVANSDSADDQKLKLRVRDAVLESLKSDLGKLSDVEEAKRYLRDNLPKIRSIANGVLARAGFEGEAVVTLCKEAFDTRHYTNFSLPAGVYETLKITIGAGDGENWWCVAFPSLCLSAVGRNFSDVAAGAGFPDALTGALSLEEGYELRFFLLDVMGKAENILFLG